MNKKYWFLIIIIVLIISVLLFWLGSIIFFESPSKGNVKSHLYKGKIVIGMETWPGYFPLLAARDKGYFKEAGLVVEIRRYVDLTALSKDYVAGVMQGRANITLDAIREHLGGLDHKVVLVIDYSNGSDAIVARPEIKTVKDFRGKPIGYDFDSIAEFFLSWALAKNNMSFFDIVPIHLDPQDAAKRLVSGGVVAGVTHEPFLSQLPETGNFHVVYSSADAPGLISDVMTFRTDFIEQHPETVSAIIQAYFRGFQLWNLHPEEVYAILAKEFNISPENIAKQFQGITMLDERDNQTAFTYAAGLESIYGNMREVGKFVQAHYKGKEVQLDTDKLIERKFIKLLHDSSFYAKDQ